MHGFSADFAVYEDGEVLCLSRQEAQKAGIGDDFPSICGGRYLHFGARTDCVCIEGPEGRGSLNIALAVNVGKTLIYREEALLDVAKKLLAVNRVQAPLDDRSLGVLQQAFKSSLNFPLHFTIFAELWVRNACLPSEKQCAFQFELINEPADTYM